MEGRLLRPQQQDVLAVPLAGEMQDSFVHRNQDQTLSYGEAEQICVRHLLGAVQPRKERAAKRQEVGGDGQVAIARAPRRTLQNRRGFHHGYLAWPRRSHSTKKAGLCEWAYGPLGVGAVQPVRRHPMMDVILGQ